VPEPGLPGKRVLRHLQDTLHWLAQVLNVAAHKITGLKFPDQTRRNPLPKKVLRLI
jgi:hypothetical protein